MAAWNLRPALLADYPRLTEIYNAVSTAPATVEDFVRIDEQRARSGPSLRILLEDGAGRIGAFGGLGVEPWRVAGTYGLSVMVEPGLTGAGLGAKLLAHLEAEAVRLGARLLTGAVRDDVPGWLTWAERRGYRVTNQYFKSELRLAEFDPAPFRPAVERACAAGYRFLTMADVDAAEGQRRLYDCDMEAALDEPGIDQGKWPPITFEEYSAQMFETPLYDPAAVVVAEKDGEWAGFSGMHYRRERNSGWIFFTGVRRGHRGHGLAQALKLLCAEYAAAQGWEKIGTSNNALNPPMLAVNRKFGFVPQPGI
ncbi:MAG TPA: GNAT family N-acetyltransferase, partial [Symbiobacteriaceae bacterium]|nr:GNAT family N-acetyltransferase [Symbiobacteriaceae bacterium]